MSSLPAHAVTETRPGGRATPPIEAAKNTRPPSARPAARLPRWKMSYLALTSGLDVNGGLIREVQNANNDVVRFSTGNRRFMYITHPEHIDHVLHAGRLSYYKSYEYELLRAILGVSLFTDEEDSWQRYRTMMSPMFAKRHLNGLVPLMIEPIETLLASWSSTTSERHEVEMVDEMVELTLNVVGNSLFSQGFGSVTAGMAEKVTTGLRFGERVIRFFAIATPPTRLWRALTRVAYTPVRLPPPFAVIQEVVHEIDDAVWGIINDRRANPIDTPDLLNLLLSSSDDDGAMSIKRVRDEAVTLMLAGHETTANALAWMWYLLAINPETRDRMIEEVDTVLQGRTPTADDLGNLPWTTAVFLESMRYFTPAWAIPRTAVRDDMIGTHRVRRGTTVMIPAHLVHHDPRWWDHPEEFDPSRFLPGAGKGRPRSAYLPFGGGKRSCIGQGFATMESVLIIAMLTQRYTFDLVPGHPVEPEATLTLRPRHGLKMVARPRKVS